MKEMPEYKQLQVLTLVKRKLADNSMIVDVDNCIITRPVHEWLLPPGNLQ